VSPKGGFLPGSPRAWSIEELGSFYALYKSSLVSHATRLLKDPARAEEVVQDALIRVILAAPELESHEHAKSYLHKTVENLCLDIFRLENRRPNLVVIDEATSEVEAALYSQFEDHSEIVAAADDAAIIRQALALLSPAERAALVMWEMEGRSASEIASELGISEKNVRHTVSRARKSLRRVLSEFVIDSERGLTALDLLSTTYRKSVSVAKKSSKAALSLMLVFFAFLGFNSLTPQSTVISQTDETVSVTLPSPSTLASSKPTSSKSESDEVLTNNITQAKNSGEAVNVKAAPLKFAGLDKSGIPMGFTITDNVGTLGNLYFKSKDATLNEAGIGLSWLVKTLDGAANIFLSQSFTQEGTDIKYDSIVSIGMNGGWIPTNSRVISAEFERLVSGNYLLTAVIRVESPIETTILIPAAAGGRDLEVLPSRVVTRAVLDPSKSQILAQAVQVIEKRAN
jgi:RNA polymerase sigma factor (sigma-70 family)